MKIIHLSDLHIGKRVNGFSMLDDQSFIFEQILEIIDSEPAVDVVILAGDIYDKPVPSGEAVQLFDDFLSELASRHLSIMIISGNHDSAERIGFGSRLFTQNNIYISPVYNGQISPITLQDSYGDVHFYLLPFVKPTHVRALFPDAKIDTYSDALATAITNMNFVNDSTTRNIIVTHQFVAGSTPSESEELAIGGSDAVAISVFDDFDYVALGHIHGPQKVGRDSIRYCGTPLKYSFSECSHKKSVTIVELGSKNDITIRTTPLIPRLDMREIRGTYEELTARSFYIDSNIEDYMHITLTDELDVPDALSKLRTIYPNIMVLDYDNARTRSHATITSPTNMKQQSPMDLFQEFYELQNADTPMSAKQASYLNTLIEEIWEEKL